MTVNNFSIREASLADAGALLEIYSYYVKETAVSFEYEIPSLSEFEERIREISSKFPYIVIEDNKSGRILGYAYAGSFHKRAAYQWCVETTIYLDRDSRRSGLGRALYDELEKRLFSMGILNLNACIAVPDIEDEHLTMDSVRFHEKMGYSMVGEFHKCGYKFDKWYNMVWMEKLIGEHKSNQKKPEFGN